MADQPIGPDGKGGTITHVGDRTIHTFTVNDDGPEVFTPPDDATDFEILVIGGGGGGGRQRGGGGGGGGGFVHIFFNVSPGPSRVAIGHGGGPSVPGEDSDFETFSETFTAIGGGAGAAIDNLNGPVRDGGSGGGGSHNDPGGTGTPSQGTDGGPMGFDSGAMTFTASGGGGAQGIGGSGVTGAAGDGGPGMSCAISGADVVYAGGGGGGAEDFGNNGLVAGRGRDGGGDGAVNAVGHDAIDGTGGGGGGGGGGPEGTYFAGGRGGNGIVIVSYKPVQP